MSAAIRFLLDVNLPRRAADAIKQLGHDATDVCDIGLGSANDATIAAHAQANSLAINTRDDDFSDIRNYPPEDYHGVVVLDLPDDNVQEVVD